MKSKLLSVAVLLATVFCMGIVEPADAATFDGISVEVVDETNVESTVLDIEKGINLFEYDQSYTAMEVCSVPEAFEGLIDHQIIELTVDKRTDYTRAVGYTPYQPRSNLNDQGFLS